MRHIFCLTLFLMLSIAHAETDDSVLVVPAGSKNPLDYSLEKKKEFRLQDLMRLENPQVPLLSPKIPSFWESLGPSVGGGGDIVKADPEDIMDAVQRTKEYLKHPKLYEIVADANRFFFEPKHDRELHSNLIYVIYPSNQFGSQVFNEWAEPIRNELAEYIDDIDYYFVPEGPCPSDNQDHAAASVHPRTREGRICFSIEELVKLTRATAAKEILGLWMHEIAHMNGFDEKDADGIQNLFLEAYEKLVPNYFNTESQIFRSLKDQFPKNNNEKLQLWTGPWQGTPPSDQRATEDDFRGVSAASLESLLTNHPTIKLCQPLPDRDKNEMDLRYQNFSWFPNRLDDDLKNPELHITRQELYFRKYHMIEQFHLLNRYSCQPDRELVCEHPTHRYFLLWEYYFQLNDAYTEFLDNILFYQRIRAHHLKNPWNEDRTWSESEIEHILGHMIRAHLAIDQMNKVLNEMIVVLGETLTECPGGLDDIDESDRKDNLESLRRIQKEINSTIISPLDRYFTPEQKKLIVEKVIGELKEEFESWHIGMNLSEEEKKSFYTQSFVKSIEPHYFEEQQNYRDVYEILLGWEPISFHHRPLDEREALCQWARDEEEYYECLGYAY